MKFIHLTDTHVIGGDRLLYGANPARRLAQAVDSINAEHADAEFVIVTGDMTHWGDDDAYGGRVRLSAKSPFKALIGGNSSISRKRSVNRGA
jgi:3',5'-cyclic AMP phosphodiesterase CpdA